MNKDRLEAFSDGVFSIVMTLLIFNIKVPALAEPFTNDQLWVALGDIWPSLVIFMLTFAVLSVFWINHHFLFESFAKSIDRRLNLLNLLYLMFIVFVPFTATLWGQYGRHQPAALLYGVNIFIIVLISSFMSRHIRGSESLLHDDVTPRLMKQARFRSLVSLVSYAIGIVLTFVHPVLAAFFYLFPVIFNIIPGTLNLAEKFFNFRLD
jgi:uncharacterized membrane protein